MIALNMAIRMRADPLMVMQNLYNVHGVPAWSAKFLIGLFNTCGRFTTIRYAFSEKRDWCFAHCKELATGEQLQGPTVSLAMAKAEGWMDRKGSKWRTMPEVMLGNRAAAFLIRSTAPELSLGLPMRDEADDIIELDAKEVEREPTPLQAVREALREAPAPEIDPGIKAAPPPPPVIQSDAPPPAPAPEPAESPAMIEPNDLPVKDGETPARKPKREVPKAPAFDVDAYAARIEKVGDVDLLMLMKEEIAALDPSVRDAMDALIDARIHLLIPNEETPS
jgi:hypothetical protein